MGYLLQWYFNRDSPQKYVNQLEYIALGTTSRDLLKMFFVSIRAKVIDRVKCRIPVFYQLRGGIPISVINKIKG